MNRRGSIGIPLIAIGGDCPCGATDGDIGLCIAKVQHHRDAAVALSARIGQHVGICHIEKFHLGLIVERGQGMLQLGELLHEGEHIVIGFVPVDLRVVEVIQFLITADLLSVIEEWHTVEGECQHCEGIAIVAIHIGQRGSSVVEVLVVIGQIDHPRESQCLRVIDELLEVLLQGGNMPVLGKALSQYGLLQPPGIVVGEAYLVRLITETEVVAGVNLCQQDQLVFTLAGGIVLEFLIGGEPVRGLGIRHEVEAEAINVATVYPRLHDAVHLSLHVSIVIVQVADVGITVLAIKPRRMGCAPRVLVGRMVGHPVKDDLHAKQMGCSHESLQVVNRTVGAVHVGKIHHGIRASATPTGVDRHQPDDIDTRLLKV